MSTAIETAWRPQSVRLTAFWADRQATQGFGLWNELTGREPDTAVKKGPVVQESGPTSDSGTPDVFAITSTLGSTALHWRAHPQPGLVPLASPQQQLTEAFEGYVADLAQRGAISRLAFGSTLFRPTSDQVTANQELAKMLPSLRVDPAARDLLYRVNRPVTSRVVADLQINRLATWAVIEMFEMVITSVPTSQPLPPLITTCQLDLDINTAANNVVPFQAEALLTIWRELVSFGTSLATSGDSP